MLPDACILIHNSWLYRQQLTPLSVFIFMCSSKCIGYADASQNSLQATNFSYIKQYSNQSGHNTTLGYGYHFQHRNSRTFPIESLGMCQIRLSEAISKYQQIKK
jgi:hypothetical protein